jgi:hypothetical protein
MEIKERLGEEALENSAKICEAKISNRVSSVITAPSGARIDIFNYILMAGISLSDLQGHTLKSIRCF